MKKIITIPVLACLAIMSINSSCKKSKSTTTTPTPTPTTTTTTPSPNAGNVDGALVSLQVNVTSVTSGFPITITTETALATFFTSTGSNSSFVDGGTVKVNTYDLVKQTNNSYLKTASIGMTPADLNFSSNNSNWVVGGAGSVPAFTYNHSVAFPEFSGTVPDSVTRSAGVTISLTGKVSNADSVILLIAAGSTSIMRTVAGTASSFTVSAADLASLPVVSDKSAIIEVVPYKITLSTQGSKTYAFIKEYAAVKSINIK